MTSIQTLERWKLPLSKHLGRSVEDVVSEGLQAHDFPNRRVHLQFEDGSDLTFQHAFYLGEIHPPRIDRVISRVAVFSEHCGFHEFWIGPDDHVEEVENPVKDMSAIDLKGMLKSPAEVHVSIEDMNPFRKKS